MRRYFVLLFLTFTFINFTYAQKISDEQVLQFVMQASQQGMNQQQIIAQLMTKGVTKDQITRIKSNYESGKYGELGGGKNSKMFGNNDRTRKATQLGINGNSENSISGDSSLGNNSGEEKTMHPDSFFSNFEEEYNKKKIFGHSVFNNDKLTFEPNINIATPENYRLGPGDEVIIDIWGASETMVREIISPDGFIVIEKVGPIYLSGKTVSDANEYIRTKLATVYSGIKSGVSNAQLTVGQIRSIQVNIMGEVLVPGTYTISPFSTIFHALYQAGGVNDIGTMRQIKVYRNGKPISTLDIYEYILEGKMKGDIRLMDGDVIVVGPYDCLVNIVGKVKRPMYYEMKKDESIGSLLQFSGGFSGDAYTKSIRVIRKSGGEHQIYNIEEFDFSKFRLMDGDSITVDSVLNRYANKVEIRGAVYRPGMFQMDGHINTLKELIAKSEGIRGDAFMNRAILHRENEDLTLEVLPINLKDLLSGKIADIPLRRNDILFIPSIHDIQEPLTVAISGEVARPGTFPYAAKTSLEDIILQAGGLREAASTVRVDISRRIKDPQSTKVGDYTAKTYSFALKDGFIIDGQAGFELEPYDEIYVRRSPGYQVQQNVSVTGEVLFGGTYTLTRKNQRLSEVIATAGGVTKEAYIRGARLERKMTPEEKFRLDAAVKMASNEVAKEGVSKNLDLGDTYYVGINLEEALKNPGGEMDVVLREGDRVIVPEYTNTVKINGNVMHPNTVTFKSGQKMKYYVNMAGGYGYRAKKSRAYVIYMNGTVARLKRGNKNAIQPGCEIIIPTKAPRKGASEILGLGGFSATLATSLATIVALFK